ncbi:MAG: alanine racemase [Duodenibacillus sp.]|nr:alanine racemase [Duodenibacillus sp.]
MRIIDADTPSLILDLNKTRMNIERAKQKAASLGVAWRPHLKTHKCVEVARLQMHTPEGPATVSTVKEAERFFEAGVRDMIYAVGIAPHKLPRIHALNSRGADVKIILDNVAAARAVSAFCKENRTRIGVLIEIDCDGHRSGLKPEDPALVAVASALTDGAQLRGVLTHAGDSYNAKTTGEIAAAAEREVRGANQAAETLRKAGLPVQIVSVGSTPTLGFATQAAGITEYRSGVGSFFDLVMAGLGVCRIEDIAVTVLVSVIGHQLEKGLIITDGGWMAMSRDRGTASQKVDCGYGLVCDEKGVLLADYWVSGANQEHGIISRRDGGPVRIEDFPIDRRLRILPNHACPTCAAFDEYLVTEDNVTVSGHWPRFNHW